MVTVGGKQWKKFMDACHLVQNSVSCNGKRNNGGKKGSKLTKHKYI